MLENEPGIDGVIISTPGDMYAPIASHAMNKGKHLYIQKALTDTVAGECHRGAYS